MQCLHAVLDLSMTLPCGITWQFNATGPLRARLYGHPAVAGLPILTDDLILKAGGSS